MRTVSVDYIDFYKSGPQQRCSAGIAWSLWPAVGEYYARRPAHKPALDTTARQVSPVKGHNLHIAYAKTLITIVWQMQMKT